MSLSDLFDSPNELLDTITTPIPASSSASPLVVVASLRCNISRILVNDTTGNFIGVYERKKNTSTDELRAIVGLEQNQQYMDVTFSQGSQISLKAMKDRQINGGEVCIQFFG